MSKLQERFEELQRRTYLKIHENEDPFPLDGTEWARLVRERQYLEKHHHAGVEPYEDFLGRLQSKDKGILYHIRTIISKAMCHWFAFKNKNTVKSSELSEPLSAEDLATQRIDVLKERLSNLSETEKDWLSHKVYSRPESFCETEKIAYETLENKEPIYLPADKEIEELDTIGNVDEVRKLTSKEQPVPDFDRDLPTALKGED